MFGSVSPPEFLSFPPTVKPSKSQHYQWVANRVIDLCEEGMRDAREALETYEQLDLAVSQARCLTKLSQLLHRDNQLDAAEETVSRAISLLTDNDDQFLVN